MFVVAMLFFGSYQIDFCKCILEANLEDFVFSYWAVICKMFCKDTKDACYPKYNSLFSSLQKTVTDENVK